MKHKEGPASLTVCIHGHYSTNNEWAGTEIKKFEITISSPANYNVNFPDIVIQELFLYPTNCTSANKIILKTMNNWKECAK